MLENSNYEIEMKLNIEMLNYEKMNFCVLEKPHERIVYLCPNGLQFIFM